MKICELDCTKDKVAFENEEFEMYHEITGVKAVKDFDKVYEDVTNNHADDDAGEWLPKLYENVKGTSTKAICDLDAGVLANKGLLNALENCGLVPRTSELTGGKVVLDTDNTLVVLEDYSNVVKNGFFGTFFIAQTTD